MPLCYQIMLPIDVCQVDFILTICRVILLLNVVLLIIIICSQINNVTSFPLLGACVEEEMINGHCD